MKPTREPTGSGDPVGEFTDLTVPVTEEHLRIGKRSQAIRDSVAMNAGSRMPLGLRCPVEAALDEATGKMEKKTEKKVGGKRWRVLMFPANPEDWDRGNKEPTFQVQLGEGLGLENPVLELPPEEGERIRRFWCPEVREMEPHSFTLRIPSWILRREEEEKEEK